MARIQGFCWRWTRAWAQAAIRRGATQEEAPKGKETGKTQWGRVFFFMAEVFPGKGVGWQLIISKGPRGRNHFQTIAFFRLFFPPVTIKA